MASIISQAENGSSCTSAPSFLPIVGAREIHGKLLEFERGKQLPYEWKMSLYS